jgi:hypothetical protein
MLTNLDDVRKDIIVNSLSLKDTVIVVVIDVTI